MCFNNNRWKYFNHTKDKHVQMLILFFQHLIIFPLYVHFVSKSVSRKLGHFERKIEDNDKNPNTLRNFRPYKKGFKKVFQSCPKKGRWV